MAKISASVLAFEKKLVCSDGYFYGTTWENRSASKGTALTLIEKSVRGTISNRLKDAIKNDPLKLNAEVEKPNLQKVDACALAEGHDTLKLYFTLKVLGGVDKPSACNSPEFQKTYSTAANTYIAEEGFKELAKRYALNIANARCLWRNRVGAEHVEVIVNKDKGKDKSKKWVFNAKEYNMRDFTDTNPEIDELATYIAEALSGKSDYLLLEIEIYAKVGAAQEVYPSEELVFDKGRGDKSKILYSVNGVAAMHSQKIGNAIRTIDTWYPEFSPTDLGPIAIEVYGAVTNLGKAFRNNKVDFYTLFDRFAQGEKLANKEQEHYVMAVLVRGGVFGESGKDKKEKD